MLRKKFAKAVSILLAVSMLLTGCLDKNDEIDELRAEIEALKSQQTAAETSASSAAPNETAAAEAVTEAATAATEATTAATTTTTTTTTEAAKPQLPEVKSGTYLNGEKMEDCIPAYTIDKSSGLENFGTMIFISDSLAVLVAADIDESRCADGVEFSLNDLKNTDYAGFGTVDLNGTYEYNTRDNADMFSEVTVRIYSYEPKNHMDYYIRIKGTFDGTAYDIESHESSSYTEPAPPQEASSDSQQTSSNNTTTSSPQKNCKYCKGSGICYLCNGLGYTIWGGTHNDCTCRDGKEPGKCYYCEGTGTQIWLIKGVRIQ